MTMPRDAIVGAVILAAAGIYWHAAGTIRRSSLDDSVGAAGVPNTLAAILAGLAVLLILRSLVLRSRQAPRTVEAVDEARPDEAPRAHFRALGMLVLGVLYLLIVPVLGYAVSIALLLAAVALYNHRKAALELALFAVLGSAGFYLLFVKILGIPLPAGFWPNILPV
jgi:hypothetical protein